MRLDELYDNAILTEGLFKDISMLLDDLRGLKIADCVFDRQHLTINLSFELNGDRGWVCLAPKDKGNAKEVFLRKLKAAAYSERHGQKPHTIGDAIRATGRIHPNSIKILTNTKELEVVGVDYGSLVYGV